MAAASLRIEKDNIPNRYYEASFPPIPPPSNEGTPEGSCVGTTHDTAPPSKASIAAKPSKWVWSLDTLYVIMQIEFILN